MSDLRVTSHYEGAAGSGQATCTVTIKKQMGDALLGLVSPSDFVGTGGCFGTALDDYMEKLDEYIATLQEFRDEVLATHRAYSETVRVDADGNVMKSK